MKRTLLVVLTIAILLFAFAGTASAFSTTPEMQSAIQKMKGLGIMEGYPDGTMGPERNITRAEFAKMAVITAGLEGSAQMLVGTSSRFSDVQTNAWYTGWINLAEARGFVKGYPDGTFQPNGNITYSEVITVLLRILGYNDNLPGTWPVNYLAKATQLGITDDVAAFNASAPAVRGNVAILAGATLDENVVEWKAADQLFAEKLVGGLTVRLIEQSFGSGVNSFTGDLLVIDWSFDGERFALEYLSNPATGATLTYTFAKEFNLAGAPHVQALQDQFVDVLRDKDGRVIYAENKNYGRVQFTGSDTGQFDRAVATVGASSIELDSKNYNLANNPIWANMPVAGVPTPMPLVAGALPAAQGVRLVKDKDGNIASVRTMNTPSTYVLVDSVTTQPRLNVKDNVGVNISKFNTDIRDADTNWAVFKDGVEIPFSALQENDLVRIRPGNGYDWKLDVFPAKAVGTLESIEYIGANPSKVIVAGKKYDLATAAPGAGPSRVQYSDDGGENFAAAAATLVDMIGDNVTLYINAFGGVEYVITSEAGPSAYIWGVVNEVDHRMGWVGVTATQIGVNAIEIINAQGNAVTYTTDSKSEFNGDDDFRTFAAGPVIIGPTVGDLVKFTVNAAGYINKMVDNANVDITLDAAVTRGAAQVNTDLNSIDIGGTWRNVSTSTVIWNQDSSNDWVMSNRKALLDFFGTAGAAVSVEYSVKNNVIEYIAVTAQLTTASDYAVVVAKGQDITGDFLDVNDKGTIKRYYDKATGGQYAAVKVDELVAYQVSGNDLTSVTTEVYYNVALEREVKTVDRANNSIEIWDDVAQTASTWYFVDADTVVYDLTGTNALYVNFNDVYAGDKVIIPVAGVATNMADANNLLYYLYIKN